jgi:hypothetical protein
MAQIVLGLAVMLLRRGDRQGESRLHVLLHATAAIIQLAQIRLGARIAFAYTLAMH